MRWYMRSVADHETHAGHRQDEEVWAICGTHFPYTALTVTLPGRPPDPQQVCPFCRKRLEIKR